MSIKLKEIPGVILENKGHYDPSPTDYKVGYHHGFADALIRQGEVKVGQNRKKLADILYDPWDRGRLGSKEQCLKLADSIIASEKSILEVTPCESLDVGRSQG